MELKVHACGRIERALDRFQEAHFWIHQMEMNYHTSDPFRWNLNAFLKSIKEVPLLLKAALQNDKNWIDWYRPRADELRTDPLISTLSMKRDLVVHRDMLVPKSTGSVGTTELRGMKIYMGVPINPFDDSEIAMKRYLDVAKTTGDVLGILSRDEDSIPCVFRAWQLPEFEKELVLLCSEAWLRIGQDLTKTLEWLGEQVPPYDLDCRHRNKGYQFMLFDREELINGFDLKSNEKEAKKGAKIPRFQQES
jgi:hypothetical protein